MNVKLQLVALLLMPSMVLAQGFAGLGSDASGFAIPQPGKNFDFPADHGPHPEYRIEWWYVTANLTGTDGRDYGVQWTLFRSALEPRDGQGWHTPQLWMGHAGLTSPARHFSAERLARGGIEQAGVTAAPFAAYIDDWALEGPDFDQLSMRARGLDFSYELDLTTDKPLIFHGDNGYSIKSNEGQASYYYSQPFYSVTGTLTLPDGPVEVSGQAWLDREWSSQPLSGDQSGWDWFSLSFDSGAKMMAFRLRGSEIYTSATWITPDGQSQSLPNGSVRLTPKDTAKAAGRDVPIVWRVELPARDVDVTVNAVQPDSWMHTSFPYWEGPVTVSGSHSGRGYLEMTGYAPR